MEFFWLSCFFIFGTVFGSFFNVVGLRVPKKINFTSERSQCPNCNTTLGAYELIPIVSYVMQGGKCRTCQTSVSPIYPIVEMLTGSLFVFSYWKLGFTLELFTAILLISMLMILFVSDMTYMIIPNKVLLFFLPLLMIARIITPLDPWYNSVIGAVVGFALLAVIIIVSKGGMGAGDMKLFGVLGIVLGLGKVLLTFFLAALFGAIVGGVFMMFKKVEKRQAIPFGPFIALAAIISFFYGDRIIQIYLSLL